MQQIKPVAAEAEARGYKVTISADIHEKAHIGVYCQHRCYPENADFSMIMLHDMGQGHNRWPNIWNGEPWNKFDVGILPGDGWVKRWVDSSWDPISMPVNGVYKLGWPKADIITTDSFKKEVAELKQSMNLKHPITVLYAPSWENDGKQHEFVKALEKLPVNLVLKQGPWKAGTGWVERYPHIIENIKEMNALHENYADNVYVADSEINIMHFLAFTDIIVSDESSVLFEALLFDACGVAVSDWLIPDTVPSRFADIPYDHVIKTEKVKLTETIEKLLNHLTEEKLKAKQHKENNFEHIGTSAYQIMQLVDSFVDCNIPAPQPEVEGALDQQALQALLAINNEDVRQVREQIYMEKLESLIQSTAGRKIVVWGAGV